MAIKVYVNDNGTPTLVEIATESAESLAKLVSAGQAQTFTDEEKAQARSNIGAPADNEVVKTVNGNSPDSNGNITPAQTGCLPTTGGTMTGTIHFNSGGRIISVNDASWKSMDVWSGSTNLNGASLHLRTTDSPTQPGSFVLSAKTADGTLTDLFGSHDGTLTWGGVDVLNPIGTVIAYASNTAPNGYLPCNGAAVSRTTYAALFAVIGTTYGAGDGSTTFNLPNLTDKFIQGSGSSVVGTVKSAGLPNITGFVGNLAYPGTGAFTNRTDSGTGWGPKDAVDNNKTYFNASLSNSIYGNSNTVQPPAVTMNFYIKY